MKTIIVGNSVTFKTDIDFETIAQLEKYDRDALALTKEVNGASVEYFRICTGKPSHLSEYGICFADQENGKAIISVLLPDKIADKKKYVRDTFFNIQMRLTELEKSIGKAKAKLDKLVEAVEATIEVIE